MSNPPCICQKRSGPLDFEALASDCPLHGSEAEATHTQPGFTTPEALKEEALRLGSPMVFEAAEYIETYHRLYAKALVELVELRERVRAS